MLLIERISDNTSIEYDSDLVLISLKYGELTDTINVEPFKTKMKNFLIAIEKMREIEK